MLFQSRSDFVDVTRTAGIIGDSLDSHFSVRARRQKSVNANTSTVPDGCLRRLSAVGLQDDRACTTNQSKASGRIEGLGNCASQEILLGRRLKRNHVVA